MKPKRFKPLFDKLYYMIHIPTAVLTLGVTVIPAFFSPETLFWTVPVLIFVEFFLISPLFGYVELREETVYIKYGFFLKKEIPYAKIRAVLRGRGFYSTSMLNLKNAFDHVDIKYNSYDVTTVSVKNNDALVAELAERTAG